MDAYRWWNSHISGADLDSPPVLVLPDIAHCVFAKICPVLLLFVIDEQDAGLYWESIQSIVQMFDRSGTVPNPLTHFSDFIEAVFKIRNVMAPQTVDDCVQFVDLFGVHDVSHFVLYQSPVFFGDPILYLETLIELRQMKHKLWTHFICRPKLVDAFFQMHSSFVTIDPQKSDEKHWRHRILVAEVMYLLVCDVFHFYPNAPTLACSFLDLAIPLLAAPFRYGVLVLRNVMALIREIGSLLPKEDLQSRMMRFIDATGKAESPYTALVSRFLFSLKQNIGKGYLLKTILARGIQQITDFDVISMTTDAFNVIPVISFLIRSAISNKFWHRACFKTVIGFMKTFGQKQDVREYTTVVVRKLFIFVALASSQRKYRTRTLSICESISMMTRIKELNWIHPNIQAYAASVNTRATPPYFRSFFSPGATCDEVILHEIDVYAASGVALKHFPFDPVKGTLVFPPGREEPISRKAISITKSDFPSVGVVRGRSALGPKTKSIQLQRNRPSKPSSVRAAASKGKIGALASIPRRPINSARKK